MITNYELEASQNDKLRSFSKEEETRLVSEAREGSIKAIESIWKYLYPELAIILKAPYNAESIDGISKRKRHKEIKKTLTKEEKNDIDQLYEKDNPLISSFMSITYLVIEEALKPNNFDLNTGNRLITYVMKRVEHLWNSEKAADNGSLFKHPRYYSAFLRELTRYRVTYGQDPEISELAKIVFQNTENKSLQTTGIYAGDKNGNKLKLKRQNKIIEECWSFYNTTIIGTDKSYNNNDGGDQSVSLDNLKPLTPKYQESETPDIDVHWLYIPDYDPDDTEAKRLADEQHKRFVVNLLKYVSAEFTRLYIRQYSAKQNWAESERLKQLVRKPDFVFVRRKVFIRGLSGLLSSMSKIPNLELEMGFSDVYMKRNQLKTLSIQE